MAKIGILHPGAMGTAVAVSIRNGGHEVYWASEGRRVQTQRRAEAAGLIDAGTLTALVKLCEVIVSVCPPEFAEVLSESVVAAGFQGSFLDANALAPSRKLRMAKRMESSGVHFVDGGIIGLPPAAIGETWICLSGASATRLAQL